MVDAHFHPAVAQWFQQAFPAPSEIQRRAWPQIAAGGDCLLAAPTGNGKTLAAFLYFISELVESSLAGELGDQTRVLYISPLRALATDVELNLRRPLQGIAELLEAADLTFTPIRTAVRTGDTPAAERTRLRKHPPHILVTTPESLFILLTSDSGRAMLSDVRAVIVDEIHAIATDKRGAHLALSLQRLDALCVHRPRRIGLSATQKPISAIADFLSGNRQRSAIIDTGFARQWDLAIDVVQTPLSAVMANEVWEEVYDRIAQLAGDHRTTLVFVNTRRLAERAARHLGKRLGDENVAAHHGSLARRQRLEIEQRLKSGQLPVLIATASLELGIDIGNIDLVCQLGSPRRIATLMQRVGRSGHSIDGIPKGRLFPLSRDDLVECLALVDAVRNRDLDRLHLPEQPLDVLAQQVIAELGCREWSVVDLHRQFSAAWQYRKLSLDRFVELLEMLANGYSPNATRRKPPIHFDAVNKIVRGARSARLLSIMNGGAIPDQFDYDVVLLPQSVTVGSVGEDFAFESLPGNIFQLGNTAYRVARVERGRVLVEDAHGQSPNIPFWFGESPGRSAELSIAVSTVRRELAESLQNDAGGAISAAQQRYKISRPIAEQVCGYFSAAVAMLGTLPSHQTIVFERFFDEIGDMHLVIHSTFGSRINRAWGLALRKRFCVKFNFELQAAANDNAIVLSLGPTHSFELTDVVRYLHSGSVREVLIQALLDAPMFTTSWRWTSTIALAVQRNRNGRRLPAQFQRSDAEDLLALVFPDQLACGENIVGEREVPAHPLVDQTLDDCLHRALDVDGLIGLLQSIESGRVRVVCRELPQPSPLAEEVVRAKPYAFLDDTAAEERRTLNIARARQIEPEAVDALGYFNAGILQRIRSQIAAQPRDAEELHLALQTFGFLTAAECHADWRQWFDVLADAGRATLLLAEGVAVWTCAERINELLAVMPAATTMNPVVAAPEWGSKQSPGADVALCEIARSRLQMSGPTTGDVLATDLGIDRAAIDLALTTLEQEGFILRGQFDAALARGQPQWCERGLLARLHRFTMADRRARVAPVSPAAFQRFLFRWQHIGSTDQAPDTALITAIGQLEGLPVTAPYWETDILPLRVAGYAREGLDQLMNSGRVVWWRPRSDVAQRRRVLSLKTSPIAFCADRLSLRHWLASQHQSSAVNDEQICLSPQALRVYSALRDCGAMYVFEIAEETGALLGEIEIALAELVAAGRINSDSILGLRTLILAPSKRQRSARGGVRRRQLAIEQTGRWSLLRRHRGNQEVVIARDSSAYWEGVEHIANVLLRRYGVVFRRLLERESLIPGWRDLLRVYRRLEARGEIHGGRFVDSISGEQFALPGAVKPLRACGSAGRIVGEVTVISSADPLNLTGLLGGTERHGVRADSWLVYRDGEFSETRDSRNDVEQKTHDRRAREAKRKKISVVQSWRNASRIG